MNRKALHIGGFIGLILIIAVVMVGWVIILGDLQRDYIDTGISTATVDNDELDQIESTYNKAEEINETFSATYESFQKMKGEGDNAFLNILSGIAAVPIAIIEFIFAIGKTIGIAYGLLAAAGTELKIPTAILNIAVVGILIFAALTIVELWRRYPAK